MIYPYSHVSLAIYFSFIILGVGCLSDLPPPKNLSLSWDHCSVNAKWSKPSDLDSGCIVNYTVIVTKPFDSTYLDNRKTTKLSYIKWISNARQICIAVRTNPLMCENKKESKVVQQCISPPVALVDNFKCIYYSDMKMNCSWNLLRNTSHLRFHYGVIGKEGFSQKPCTSYITNGPQKTGCHIDTVDIRNHMCFIINQTTDVLNTPNSFVITTPKDFEVKTSPPKLNIIREGEHLHFQSSKPEFHSHCWKHAFKYRKCKEKMDGESIGDNKTNWSVRVQYDETCRYTVRVQAKYNDCYGFGESDWSGPEEYGEDVDPNWPLKVSVVVVPVIVSCCLIMALVLVKRHKHIFLPAIPEPTLLFKDMLNSNNDVFTKNIAAGKLYVPIKEDVEMDVRLEPKSVPCSEKPHITWSGKCLTVHGLAR